MRSSLRGDRDPSTLGVIRSWSCGIAIAVGATTLAAAFTSTHGFAGEQNVPSPNALVEKAIEFHGGMKALNRDVPLIRTEESDVLIDGEKFPVTSTWQYQPPDKRAFQAIVKISGLRLNMHQAISGTAGWAQFGPAPAADLTPKQIDGIRWEHRNHVRSVQLLATTGNDFDAAAAKATRFNDRDAWQVTFTMKSDKNNVVTVFFDKTTGQVLGDESLREVPTLGANQVREKSAMFRVVFKTYMNVDGMKMPETMSIYRDGKQMVEVRKAEMRVVDAVDPKVFEKPK